MYTSCEGQLTFSTLSSRDEALSLLINAGFIKRNGDAYHWAEECGELQGVAVERDSLDVEIESTMYYRFEPVLEQVLELAKSGEVAVTYDESMSLWVWKNGDKQSLDDTSDVIECLEGIEDGFHPYGKSLVNDALSLDDMDFDDIYPNESKSSIVWDCLDNAAKHLLTEMD